MVLSQRRLADYAETDPNNVQRWIDDELIARQERAGYRRAELHAVAVLAALRDEFSAELVKTVWQQIEDDIDEDAERLEVVVRIATERAWLVDSAAELDRRVPRGGEVFVIDLAERIRRADAELDEFLAAHPEIEE
jgi:hypothetical protein